MSHTILFTLLLSLPVTLGAQTTDPESFDTSGMPRRPTTFVEQQLFEMLGTHHFGDLADAARIQRKLGRYYTDNRDERRANVAFLRAAAAERELGNGSAPDVQRHGVSPVLEPPGPSRFAGKYFGYAGRTLHTWEFYADGTFLHTWIASGANTSVRNSERGAFRLAGRTLELRPTSSATAFVTPGVGGRSTLAGGGNGASAEVRRLEIQILGQEDGIILDGQKLRPKSW
jgi:hypothetical protein